MNKDNFCVGPWVEIRVNSNGSLNYCHAANNTKLPIKDSILTQDLDAYFNSSQSVLAVRKNLENGQSVPRCHECYHEESLGCDSFRQRRNIQCAIFPGHDFDQSLHESGFMSRDRSHPKFYHVSFSNLCNMACMMCHSQNSTKLASFLRKSGISQHPIHIQQDWTVGSAWANFCQHLLANNEIVGLHIMGGEPMYHRKFRELLEFLCYHDHTDFDFSFVTNGSVYDESVMSLLENFRSVAIEISIEGIGLENDYVRHTSNTGTILQNIDSFLRHRSDTLDVVLRTVPQALSVYSYHRVLQFCQQKQIVVDSNPLRGLHFLHSSVLPDDIKAEARLSLEPFLTQNTNSSNFNLRNRHKIDTALSANASFVLAHLDSTVDQIESLRHKFADYCWQWDKTRGYKLQNYIPRLDDFARQYGYDPV